MKLVLIYVQTLEGNNVNPPLGVLYLAAVARDAGHDVTFLDVDPDEIDITDKLQKLSPDMVGLSFLTTEFAKAQKLSFTIKKVLPDVLLCCGGIHTTLDTENVLRTFSVDFCVVGEGEKALLQICERVENKKSYSDVKGVWLIKDNQLIKNPRQELIEDLDSLPFPARDIVNFEKYYLTFPGCIKGKYVRSTAVIAGRGCNFSCNYCAANKLMGKKVRLRSPKNVVDEIVHLQKTYGVKGILFQDSTLTANKKWAIALCNEIIERNAKFVWSCNTRVDCVDRDLLKIMKQAGCIQVEYGVESGSSKILKLLNKKTRPELAIEAFKATKENNIRAVASYMLGNPGEDRNDLEMTFDLSKKLYADYSVFFFSIPYPGTELWDIAIKSKLIPENISFDTNWNIRAAEVPLMSSNVSAEELQEFRAKLQNHFFIRNYFRFNNFVIGFQLLWIILLNPSVLVKGIKRIIKYKRFDSLVEEVLVSYRKNLIK